MKINEIIQPLQQVAAENKLRLNHGREFRAAVVIFKKDLIIKNLIKLP